MARRFRWVCLSLLTLSLSFWILVAPCWAQTYGQEEPKGKNYVPCYIVIIMCVVVGLTVICRMGKRSADIRRPT